MTNRALLLGGITMIVLAVGIVLVFGLSLAGMSEEDPFNDGEIAKYLTDVNDNEGAIIAAAAVGIVVDTVIALVFASLVFVLFRDRSRLLALLAFGAFLAGGALTSIVDGSNILLTQVAEDFVKGGPNGLAAGDPAALEAGRVLAMATLAFNQIASTALALGFVSLGMILALAPQGAVNPPRWLGWIAIITGIAGWLAWFIVVTDVAFVFFPISGLGTLIVLLGVGGWLIAHRDQEPAPALAAA
jgi:hypothetical protein